MTCVQCNYCSLSDFVEATETISEDLSIIGLPPVVKYNEQNPGSTIVSLINVVWSLLQNRQCFIDSKRNLEEKLQAVSQELSFLKEKQSKLENILQQKENFLSEKKKMLMLKSDQELQAAQKIKSLRKEVHELKQLLKVQDLQFKHSIKRQQNEIGLLQSKLRGIMSKEKGENWKGLSDFNVTCKSPESCRKEELYKKCIYRLESNIQSLIKENLDLRKLLDNVNTDLADMLKKTTNKHSDIS